MAFCALHIKDNGHTYRVSDVKVDVTATSAVAAKESAIAQGQSIAFQALLKSILPPEQLSSAMQERSEDFLEDFEIQSQKFSDRRFVATLAYTFNKHLLKEKLFLSHLPSIESDTPGEVPAYFVLPLLIQGDQAKLWEQDNPWLQAWADYKFGPRNFNLITPLSELKNIIALKPNEVLALQIPVIQKFVIDKYKVPGALVAIYRAPDLKIHVIENDEITTLNVPGVPLLDSKNPDYKQLIEPILTALSLYVRKHNSPVSPQQLRIFIASPTLRDFLHIQSILKNIPIIRDLKTLSLSTEYSQMEMTLTGNLSNLRFSLQTNGLYLSQGQHGEWWITRTKVS